MGSNYFNYEEVIGKKYNNLTVINVFYDSKSRRNKLLCKCDCGNEISIQTYRLNLTKSCGRCNLKSFEQWCIDNSHEYILDLWDYELNDKKPSEISHGVRYKAYFKCPKGIHESKQKLIYIVTRDGNVSCAECSSFGQWCIDNELQEWLDLWDYDLNNVSPFEIGHASVNKYYFKCSRGLHESELSLIGSIIRFRYLKCSKCNSIGQWMLDNLGEDSINKCWDYSKNKKSPFCINFGSSENKIWIKCLKDEAHGSYEIYTTSLTSGGLCPICANKRIVKGINDIATTHPDLVNYFSNVDDTNKYSYGSTKKVIMKCPDCGYEKLMAIGKLYTYGFSCDKCGDKVPYPEKFMLDLLNQCNISFIKQLNKKQFKWCGKYRYDFYIPSLKCIVETHGMQHYEYGFNTYKQGRMADDEKENDRLKEELALNNNIDSYIIIDCRYSRLEWIKASILSSGLLLLLNIKEKDIDWLKCERSALSSKIIEACNLWNGGIRDVKQIGNIINISFTNVTKYLKKCAKLDICDYDPKIERAKGLSNLRRNDKKVKVIEDGRVFDSIVSLVRQSFEIYGVEFDRSCVSGVCNKRAKSHKKHHFEFIEI